MFLDLHVSDSCRNMSAAWVRSVIFYSEFFPRLKNRAAAGVKTFVFSLKKHFYFLKRFTLWTQSYIILHFFSCTRKCATLWWAMQPHFCSLLLLLLLSNEIRTNSPGFAVRHIFHILQIWQEKFSSLPSTGWRWGQLNKDSISLWPDRQLRKYLQPHCNAAKWTLEQTETSRGLRKLEKDSAGVVSSDGERILYNPAWFCYI